MKTFKMLLLLLAPLLLGVCSTAQGQRKGILAEYPELKNPVVAQRGAVADADSVLSGPQIIVVCSTTKARTAEAIIQWPGQMRSFEQLRLDVSFYKQGFANNRYAILWPMEKSRKARVVDQKMQQSRELSAGLELTVLDMARGDAGQGAQLKLEGLDPGKTYFWRLLRKGQRDWQSSEVIRIEAPTCPVDFIERQ